MKILLENVILKDKESPHYGKVVNILINDGVIESVQKNKIATKTTQTFDLKGMEVYPGFMDARVHSGAPGNEQKEDWSTLSKACLNGGITSVAIYPDTQPKTETSDQVKYISQIGKLDNLEFYSLAALTKGFDGINFTDIMDLSGAGAIGFTDVNPLENTKTLELALQYTKAFNGLVVDMPLDMNLSANKMVNESLNTTKLGLPGIPVKAEVARIERNLSILEYVGGRLHMSLVTTGEGVEVIKKARKKGLNVTCDTALHYLYFDDSKVEKFDSNYKVFPPLRSKKDVQTLRKAVKEGVIDFVVSDHSPQNQEIKDLEFDQAEFGITGVETLAMGIHDLQLDLYDVLVAGPRKVFALNIPQIKEGEMANLSVVRGEVENTVQRDWFRSKSKNSPFIGKQFRTQIVGVIKNNTVSIETN